MTDFDKRFDYLIKSALDEDVGDGDHSTLCCIPANESGKAILKIKQDGILAGVNVAEAIFKYVEEDAFINIIKKDGELMHNGETAFEVSAKIYTILKCERLVLNCMQRMSGIDTPTQKNSKVIRPGY